MSSRSPPSPSRFASSGTREAVSRLVLLLLIDVRIVRSDGGVRSLTAVAAGFVIGGGILVAGVPIGVVGALLGEV